jgi:hypothetical protein
MKGNQIAPNPGWNVVKPSGLTTADADTAILTAAFANAFSAPVWLSPGIYYSCGGGGPAIVTRGGTVASSGVGTGIVTGGTNQIDPWPHVVALIYCSSGSAAGPIIKLHDNTILYGFAIQGNNGFGGNQTCISAINTVDIHIHDMEFFGCGTSTDGGPSTTAAIDVSSSSVAGDQGTITQGIVMDNIVCSYTGHCVFGTNANGGNGVTDSRFTNFECAGTHDRCFRFLGTSESIFNNLRFEDNNPGMEFDVALDVTISNVLCHLLAVNYCLIFNGGASSAIKVQIDTFLSVGTTSGPDILFSEKASQQSLLRITNTNGTGQGAYASTLQYVTNGSAGRTVNVDTSVTGFDAASQAVIMLTPLGGPAAEFALWRYAWTLAAGTLQLFACTTGRTGVEAIISDYNTTYPAVDTTLTVGTAGGGTTAVPLVCNGTNWKSR